MATSRKRLYQPSPKHKAPRGWGSVCPPEIDERTAQELLNAAVTAKVDDGTERVLYNVRDGRMYAGRSHRAGLYHGYPVKGTEVPPSVLKALRDNGRIDATTYKRLLKES